MASSLQHLPMALGGDALSRNNIAIAAVSLLSIAGGYVLLAALWYFVFRQRPEDREAERRSVEASFTGTPGAPAPPPDSTGHDGDHDGGGLQRHRASRFRRR